jgi:D-tyrosyl-tRNA(Tyr) deacylase
MKILIQRVLEAQCIIDNEEFSSIQKGLLLYSCFEQGDSIEQIQKCVSKILSLRIFEDDQERMNYNIEQVKGQILNISQFTLSWKGEKGNRPNFTQSLAPQESKILFDDCNTIFKKQIDCQTGVFGADMKIRSINDGPVTFFLSF